MESIILSKQKVKPSKATPQHLRKHKLCVFDQVAPDVCITPIFFYKNTLPKDLKWSLSETLTLFYPLAGEICGGDPTFVNCNDNGVVYVEAHVKARLSDVLENPNLSKLHIFLPQKCSMGSMIDIETLETLVSLQVTTFDCGGIAIGGAFSHKLLDGTSVSLFLNTWAKIARGDHNIQISLDFTSSSLLFPPQETFLAAKTLLYDEEEAIVRRFKFNAKAIADIKMKASSETRVEGLTAFIWKHMILATREVRGTSSRPSLVAHCINLRSRIYPQLPNAFGNLFRLQTSAYFSEILSDNISLSCLVGIVRHITKESENLKGLDEDSNLAYFVDMATQIGKFFPEVDIYKFTSWCRFGLYDVDFGWGKPIWTTCFIEPLVSLNLQQVILVEDEQGDGIEALILRNKKEMLVLENDQEFLAYASPNPSIYAS